MFTVCFPLIRMACVCEECAFPAACIASILSHAGPCSLGFVELSVGGCVGPALASVCAVLSVCDIAAAACIAILLHFVWGFCVRLVSCSSCISSCHTYCMPVQPPLLCWLLLVACCTHAQHAAFGAGSVCIWHHALHTWCLAGSRAFAGRHDSRWHASRKQAGSVQSVCAGASHSGADIHVDLKHLQDTYSQQQHR